MCARDDSVKDELGVFTICDYILIISCVNRGDSQKILTLVFRDGTIMSVNNVISFALILLVRPSG